MRANCTLGRLPRWRRGHVSIQHFLAAIGSTANQMSTEVQGVHMYTAKKVYSKLMITAMWYLGTICSHHGHPPFALHPPSVSFEVVPGQHG